MYTIHSNFGGTIFSECLDPFDEPECEAFDLFVNQTVCIGKGTPPAHTDIYTAITITDCKWKFSIPNLMF